MEEKQSFFVESVDGRKFKMVIRGDLGKLSVAKVRRYLKSYGVPDGQTLTTDDGTILADEMVGEEFGLADGTTLRLHEPDTAVHASGPSSLSAQMPQPSPAQNSVHIRSVGARPAWHEPSSASADPPAQASSDEVESLRALVRQLQDDKKQLENQLYYGSKKALAEAATNPADRDPLANAKQNLLHLANDLNVVLQFDSNLSCVIGTDDTYSILVTFDPSTERLYVYSSILTSLPGDPAVRMKLYEILLEGSLLGREVCGGGIGLSLQNNVVVLTTSLLMRYSDPHALRETMPVYVETLNRWRALVFELVKE